MPDKEVVVLSEEQIAEIEVTQIKRRESLAFHQSEYPGLPSPSYVDEIDALCATVRALRTSFDISEAARGHDGESYRELLRTKDSENAALREQLAETQDYAAGCEAESVSRGNRVIEIERRCVGLQSQLAQVKGERDELKRRLKEWEL